MPKKTSHIRFSSFSKIDCELYFSSFFLDLFGILTVLSSFVCFVKFSLSCCNHFTCHLYSYSIILFYSFLQICTGICEGSLGHLKIFIQLFFLFQHSSLSLSFSSNIVFDLIVSSNISFFSCCSSLFLQPPCIFHRLFLLS